MPYLILVAQIVSSITAVLEAFCLKRIICWDAILFYLTEDNGQSFRLPNKDNALYPKMWPRESSKKLLVF